MYLVHVLAFEFCRLLVACRSPLLGHVLAGRAGLQDGGECGTLRSVRGLVPSHRPPEGLSRRRQGASLGGSVYLVAPGDDVIGLRQVDGMAQRPLSM
jgi:hypothetical protein